MKLHTIDRVINTVISIWICMILAVSRPGFAQPCEIVGDSEINRCEIKTYMISLQNDSGYDLSNLVITNDLSSLTGFSYVAGSTLIAQDVDPPFCTEDPVVDGNNLIWDFDSLCSSSYSLPNNSVLNLSLDLITGCTAISGSMHVSCAYDFNGTPSSDDAVYSIQVLPGAVTIKKTPNVVMQEIGQNVTWTIMVENIGWGTIENVEVTDVLDDGLLYVSSTPEGVNAGQSTLWDFSQVPEFSSMNPGDWITLDITAKVLACGNPSSLADVRWGCDETTDCFNTATEGGTAKTIVQRVVKSPLIDYTPPDISFTYCDDQADVDFTITNIGDATAYDLWIIVDFGSLDVSEVSTGAIFDTINDRFELTDPIPPGSTYDLSFKLNDSDWCGSSFPTGDLVWQNSYQDECGQEFYSGLEIGSVIAPASSPNLSLSVTGMPEAVRIGEQVTYNVTSSYSGLLSCSGSTPGDITVEDAIPDGFTVVDDGGGVYVPGGGGTGGTLTWTYTPPASLNTAVTLQTPDTSQCEAYCFTEFTHSVVASGTDCCGCVLNASDSQTGAIECSEGVISNKISSIPNQRCEEITYTNTYDFLGGSSVLLSDLQFEEHAENQQQYVPGTLSVLYDSSDITGCVIVTDNTPGGSLHLDFSGCAADSVANKNLTIVYQLTITPMTAAACDSTSFYSWSSLNMGTVGGCCLQDGIIHETTLVTIDAPALSLSISGLDETFQKCETETLTLTLAQTSTIADPKDVRLVLSGLNYYVIDPGAVVCGGIVAPISCQPAVVGDDYVWYFGDGFTGLSQSATLQLDVRKRCPGSGDLVATAYYDDFCNDDSTYDDTCSTITTETPASLLSGDLLIEMNPSIYYATSNTVQWKIYITNRGTGTAYNVWIDDVLGAGLDYVSAVVDNMTGVTITADQDHQGNPINGCTISITQMAAGERREITLTSLLIDCDNLTNNVSSSWGCIGQDCIVTVTDSSVVEIQQPLIVPNHVLTTPADACSNLAGTITLKNAGQTACYDLQLTETLPPGLNYISGTTRWRLNQGSWNGPNAAYDPDPTTSPLMWTSTEIPALAQMSLADTIEIEFDLEVDCPFMGGDATLSTQYENPCGQVFTASESIFTVAFQTPDIIINKTRSNNPIGCNDMLEWTITVQNISGYTLPIIWVEDTMDAAFTYTSSVGDPPYTNDNGTNVGQVTTWELRNVNHGDTVTLILNATTDTAPCSSDLDNTVEAWWGCGTPDGSSATKPGVDPPDNTLCLTSSGVSFVRTETREPDIGFLSMALNPSSIDSCNDSTQITVIIENTGNVDSYTNDLVIDLPDGLTYNAGTAESGLGIDNSSAITAIGAIGDPAISGNTLTFYDISDKGSNIAPVIQADGGNDNLALRFSVESNCYTTADMDFTLYYYDCCDVTQYNINDSLEVVALYPELSISQTPLNSQVDCGAQQSWTIQITNNGTANAQVVRIEDTPGDWIDVNIPSSSPGLADIGGCVYGWEINNLAAGASQEFTIVGTLNPDGFPNQSDCTTSLRQNQVSAIWGCGTSGDAIDNDPTTTAYDCEDSTIVNANAATLRMADLVVTGISPSITAASDEVIVSSISVQVNNQGDGSCSDNFTVEVTDGKGWTGTGTHSGAVAAGNSVDVAIDTGTWSPSCLSCASPYSFNAIVDLNNDVCECDETNNSYGPDLYTQDIPDLVVQNEALAVDSIGDGTLEISGTVTLANQGCGSNLTSDIPMRFTLYSDKICGGMELAQWTHTLESVNIASGGGTQVFDVPSVAVFADLCVDTNECGFSIFIEADYSESIAEWNGTNNTYCVDNKAVNLVPDWTAEGETASDFFSLSVSNAGDINGDGYSDVIVGALGYSGFQGCVFVYSGSATGLAGIPSVTLTGENSGDYFGYSISGAGDVNGDDYSDIIIGAYGYDGSRGRVYVYQGPELGLSVIPSATFTGENSGDLFGSSVSSAGDVNGDHYSDVIIGAYGYSSSTGRVYIYQGSALGLAEIPSATFTGEMTGDCFGFSVACAGDVDGNNYSDVIVGAIGFAGKGRAYVYQGSAAGLGLYPYWLATGENPGDYFGCSVSGAGNWDGYGSDDVIVGAFGWSFERGRAYLYRGSTGSGLETSVYCRVSGEDAGDCLGRSVSNAGEFGSPGVPNVMVSADGYSSDRGRIGVYCGPATAYDLSPSWIAGGEGSSNAFGYSVSDAGDVNFDGAPDLIVGAYGYDGNRGKAYAFYGCPPLPTETPTPTATSTSTLTPTSTQTPSITPTPTETESPTSTSTLTNTPTSTFTETELPTFTFTPTSTQTPSFTATETPTGTPTDTSTNTPTSTPSATSTQTPFFTRTQTPTSTSTLVPSMTPTIEVSPTSTMTPISTWTATETPSVEVTNTPVDTPTITLTSTATAWPSSTPTVQTRPTRTLYPTVTFTHTQIPSETFTPTPTRTVLPENTPTQTATALPTATPVIEVLVIPDTLDLVAGSSRQFAALVTGTTNTEVDWWVNDVPGGNSSVGIIAPDGVYTAPIWVPSPPVVTLRAVSRADNTKSATALITIRIGVNVSSTSASILSGATHEFSVEVVGTLNTDVTWYVNGIEGGNGTSGWISSEGIYQAPEQVFWQRIVIIEAVSEEDETSRGQVRVTILPVIEIYILDDQGSVIRMDLK